MPYYKVGDAIDAFRQATGIDPPAPIHDPREALLFLVDRVRDEEVQQAEEILYSFDLPHENSWANHASDLHAAAGVLYLAIDREDHNEKAKLGLGSGFQFGASLPQVKMMLCGLSIELALKAVIASRKRALSETHALRELAADSGVRLAEADLGCLDIWQQYLEWAGRYPRPGGASNPAKAKARRDEKIKRLRRSIKTHVMKVERALPGGVQFLTFNDALGWENYDRIWREIMRHFSSR